MMMNNHTTTTHNSVDETHKAASARSTRDSMRMRFKAVRAD